MRERLRKKAKTQLAADKRRLTRIENNELVFVFCVHPQPGEHAVLL
jgi:hypothetical protein